MVLLPAATLAFSTFTPCMLNSCTVACLLELICRLLAVSRMVRFVGSLFVSVGLILLYGQELLSIPLDGQKLNGPSRHI